MHYSRSNFWLLCGLGMAAIIAAHLLPHAVRGEGAWSLPAIGFGGLMLLGVGLFGISYGAMDDIQRQNMKSDWYWGSVLGLCALCGVVFPAVLFGSGLESIAGFFHGAETPKEYFFCGIMVMMGPFGLGYLLVYLFRRLREIKS